MLSVPLVKQLSFIAESVEKEKEALEGICGCGCECVPVDQRSQLRRVVMKLDDEVMGRGVAPAAIALAVLEEREEAKEGERGDKEGEEMGGKEGGDGNEEKSGRPTAHREFVERMKENQGKLEEAMALLVVEALGLVG
ncbi:uncharacterized protein MONOS_12750 [Monocercomonoides exilis]|uniref:uncharacterized protein n=1 Tax=Monocercomonoides exilis TaxID=2049356 RepID=UPI00355AAEF5|nr:hypothetical protein MONOS_12750 [Monocercomonoides exilis]|eukprot:MONOS_12750.1-p1 / transcript=MONOS_12750.1 / gene=MONOS_12750 / organism=Monocercomonoides_exilis_PA203 / gene_product=unspecified product / transcript_product=unspecified product / location=Mono_scaffold00729:4712-5253(-) / protein_length=138 / sequence_SO=supercontig / SO=protein_coding / is_pseudo=false